jgi:hypothetical protein
MFKDQTLDFPKVVRGNPAILSKNYRIKPKLALSLRRTNMNMSRLKRFIRIKVKTVGAYPQYRRHIILLHSLLATAALSNNYKRPAATCTIPLVGTANNA